MKARELFDKALRLGSRQAEDEPFDEGTTDARNSPGRASGQRSEGPLGSALPTRDTESAATFCAAHPRVETALRCGKCNTLICPKCVVQTPVGARCAKCANLRRLPIFEVSPKNYAKAVALAFSAAPILGFVWASLPFRGYFSFIISAGVGYALGEIVSFAAGRKSSLGLKIVAGTAFALCYLSYAMLPVLATLVSLNAITTAAFLQLFISAVVGLLSNPFAWLMVGLGVFMAVTRMR